MSLNPYYGGYFIVLTVAMIDETIRVSRNNFLHAKCCITDIDVTSFDLVKVDYH